MRAERNRTGEMTGLNLYWEFEEEMKARQTKRKSVRAWRKRRARENVKMND